MRYEDRFTEGAKNVLNLAYSAAAELGHSYVGSEHILIGFARKAAAWPQKH
jgi:ATP-dependent Clp protease ATP-binding subunit ClpC